LPLFKDDENNPISVILDPRNQKYITYNSVEGYFLFNLKNLGTDLGTFTIRGSLSDQRMQTNF